MKPKTNLTSKIILACSILFIIMFGFILCNSVGDCNKEMRVYAASVSSETVTVETPQEETEEQFDWGVWFKDKAMPVLVAVGAGIVAICGILAPVLNTISGGVKLFKNSKTDMDTMVGAVKNSQGQVATICKETKQTSAEIKESFKQNKEQIAAISSDVKTVINVIKILVCNNSELVKNGYANEIMKLLGENDEKIETQNNSNGNT